MGRAGSGSDQKRERKNRIRKGYIGRNLINMANSEVIIVAIVFGSVFGIVFLGILSNIIKAWIKRSSPEKLSENKEFLAALREFKENTDRRISNLEAIIADEEWRTTGRQGKMNSSEERSVSLDIELENQTAEEKPAENSYHRNVLNQ